MRTWLINRLAWMDGAMADLVDTVEVVEPPIGGLKVRPSLFHEKVEFWLDVVGTQKVTLDIYDVHGRQVHHESDYYRYNRVVKLVWEAAADMPIGIYFYRIKVGSRPPKIGKLVKH